MPLCAKTPLIRTIGNGVISSRAGRGAACRITTGGLRSATITIAVATLTAFRSSTTLSLTVYLPGRGNDRAAVGPGVSNVPSPSRSQACEVITALPVAVDVDVNATG